MSYIAENANTTHVTDYNNDDYEYFTNVERIKPIPETIKSHIPKYMPLVSPGDWQEKVPITVESMEANAPECRVKFPKWVLTQGYVTIGHYPNEHPDFTEKAELIEGILQVEKGNKFIAEVLYSDASEIKFIGKV